MPTALKTRAKNDLSPYVGTKAMDITFEWRLH